MAVKVGELYETLELRDRKFKKSMASAKKDSRGLSGVLGGIGKVAAAGAATAGAALAGAAAKGMTEFNKLDKQMNEVFTLMPDASEEAKNKMTDDLRAFSEEMGVATDEAAPALYQAISAGVPKDNVFDFMEQAQKSATAGVTDLTTSVDALSSVVNTYGKDAMSAEKASDIMFTAVQKGKTTYEELSANISEVAPMAASMGVEFEDVSAALSTMTSQGESTRKATTKLKQMMSELSKEGSKAGKAFKDVAGESFQSFIENGGSMEEAMRKMEQAAKDSDTTVSNLFGSVEAGQAATFLTGESMEKFAEDTEAMGESSGATEKAYEQMEKSLSRNMDKIKSAMEGVWLEVGEKLMPIMQDLTDWIIENMPQIKETVGAVFDAVIKSIRLAIDAYKDIRDFVQGFVSTNSENLNNIKSDYSEIFGSIREIIEIFVGWAKTFWDTFGSDITKIARAMWETIRTIFNTKLDIIRELLSGIVKLMKGDFEGFGEDMGEIVTLAFEALTKVFRNSWENIIKPGVMLVVDNVAEEFKNLPEKLSNIGGQIVEGLKEGITGKAEEAIKSAQDAAKGVADGVKSFFGIKSPSKLMQEYGKNTMEGLAKGIEDNQDAAVNAIENAVAEVEEILEYQQDVEDDLRKQQEMGRIAMGKAIAEAKEERIKRTKEALSKVGAATDKYYNGETKKAKNYQDRLLDYWSRYQDKKLEDMTEQTKKENEERKEREQYQQDVQDKMNEAYRKGQIKAAQLMQEMSNQSNTLWDNVKDKVVQLKNKAKDIAINIGLSLKENVISGLKSIIGGLKSAVSDVIGESKSLQKMTTAISSMYQRFIGKIAKAFEPLFQTIMQNVLPVLDMFFNKLASALIPVIKQLVNALVPVITTFIQGLAPILRTVVQIFSTLLQAILPVVQILLETVLPIINRLLQALLPVIQTIVEGLAPILELAAQLFGQLLQAVMPIIETIMSLLVPILDALFQVLQPVIQVIVDVLTPVLNFLATVFKKVGNFIISIWNGIVSALNKIPFINIQKADKIGEDDDEKSKDYEYNESDYDFGEDEDENTQNKEEKINTYYDKKIKQLKKEMKRKSKAAETEEEKQKIEAKYTRQMKQLKAERRKKIDKLKSGEDVTMPDGTGDYDTDTNYSGSVSIDQEGAESLASNLKPLFENLSKQMKTMINDKVTTKLDTQISLLKSIDASLQGPRQIQINANYYVNSRDTAEAANNDLVKKLQGRGLAGALR